MAFHERNRYLANRIAQTELQRAYADRKDGAMLEDPNIEYVQWRLSGSHPVFDICDMHAKLDAYGLGPGIYPKAEAPRRPAHPFCRCVLVPRLGLTGEKARRKPGAERAWLRDQGVKDGARVMGSRAKLEQALRGGDLAAILNKGAPEGYGYRLLGDVRPDAVGARVLSGLQARGERLSGAPPSDIMRGLFVSDESYARHLSRRMASGDVLSESDYAAKTLGVLASANRLTVAEHRGANSSLLATGKVSGQEWAVLLSAQGEIITSYKIRPDKLSFEDRHKNDGDTIYDIDIDDAHRRAFERLFGRR